MKSFVLAVMFALVGSYALAGVAMDTKPKYGTPEWAAYVQADKDAKAANEQGNYEKVAETTPFSWVKAWALYNEAGSITGKQENGLWNFAKKAKDMDGSGDEDVIAEIKDLLRQAHEAAEAAEKSGIYPAKGPNSLENLRSRIDHALKVLGTGK